jgi:hypothetical protein
MIGQGELRRECPTSKHLHEVHYSKVSDRRHATYFSAISHTLDVDDDPMHEPNTKTPQVTATSGRTNDRPYCTAPFRSMHMRKCRTTRISGRGVYLGRTIPHPVPHCMPPYLILYSAWVPSGQTKLASSLSARPEILPRARFQFLPCAGCQIPPLKPVEKSQATSPSAGQGPPPSLFSPTLHCSKPSFPMAPPSSPHTKP